MNVNKTRIAAACFALALAAGTALAQPGPEPGAGPGPGAGKGQGGPGKGMGAGPAGKGPGFSFGSSNTRGWSMMSAQERSTHQQRMLSVKTLDECKAALEEHRQQIEARAKERGVGAPRGPRQDMCEIMKQRGRIS